jgi:diguanylate cyclase (GGDEF)-like protein/PAS domain S-box-containing protein
MRAADLDDLPYAVLVTTSAGLVLSANAGLLALVGGEAAHWQQRPMAGLLTADCHTWLTTQGLPALQRMEPIKGKALQLQGLAQNPVTVLAHCQPAVGDFSGTYHWLFLASQVQPECAANASAPKERFIRAVTNALPSPMAYWDKDLRCRFSNQRYLEWFGKTSQEMQGIHIRDMMGERLFGLNRPYIEGALAGTPQEFEREMTRPDGAKGYTLVNYVPDIDSQGAVQGFNALVTNVTHLREADAAIRLSASVFDSTSEGIIVSDISRKIVSANPAASHLTGYAVTELVGQSPRMLDSDRNGDAAYDAMEHALLTRGHWAGEQWMRRKDGQVARMWVSLSTIRNEAGKVVRHLGLFNDITERHGKEELVRHMALHDGLTDLPNRVLLMERLSQLLAVVMRGPHPIAVLFMDLDGFKQVNDRLGHGAGDQVLKTVAQRLVDLLRSVDTVARLGGDEFVVVLDNPEHQDHVVHIAQRIIAAVNLPIAVDNQQAHVGCSIGIAMHPQQGTSADELLKSADDGMYAAKAAGKNTFQFGSLTQPPPPAH